MRIRRQRRAGFRGQVAIGAHLRPPNPAPDLVKLAEAEHIRTVDNHCVRGRNIQSTFNNRRGKQHVILAVIEGVHALIQLPRRHLAMGHDVGNLGDMGLQEVLDLRQVLDARDDVKALPAPVAFAQKRLAQRDGVEFRNIGADRQPVDRGRADDRQVADPGQRQLQRARDRRRGQGQDVDL